MTVVIRTVSPVSLTKREDATGHQPGIRPSPLSRSRTSSSVASAGGRIRSEVSSVPSSWGTALARTPASSVASAVVNAVDVAGLDARLDGGVELVEPADRVVGDVELALAEDPDDHASAPRRWSTRRLLGLGLEDVAVVGGLDRLGLRARLEPRQLGLDVGAGAERVELAGDVVAAARLGDVVEGAGGEQLVDGAGAGLHLRGLVLGALDRHPDVAHLLADAGHGLVDLGLGLGGGVGRLDGLLAGPEGLDLRLQPLLGEGELLLLALELGVLGLEVGDLLGEPGLAGQRLAGEVLATHRDRLLGLPLELGRLLLELVDLQLHPLATGGDVGHPAAHLHQQVLLALVAVVEGLARILRLVEGLVGLRPEDQADALHEAHGPTLGPNASGAKAGSAARVGFEVTPIDHRPKARVVPPKQVETPAADRPPPTKEGGKGRPTPTRKEAEAAAKARAKPPRESREAAAYQRQHRTESSRKIRQAMKNGDERYFLARDKGPVRRFIRDYVDVRFSFLEIMIPRHAGDAGARLLRQRPAGKASATSS